MQLCYYTQKELYVGTNKASQTLLRLTGYDNTPEHSLCLCCFRCICGQCFWSTIWGFYRCFPRFNMFCAKYQAFFLAHTTFSCDIALYLCCVCHCFVNVHDFEPLNNLQFEFTPILKKLHMTFHFFLDHQQFFSRSRQIGNNIGQMHTFLGWFFYRGSRVAGGCTQLAVQ
uniref:(northern house mosquito) hypothetical protein n=1 Tax=Culex pipiens TaxID=7175 RepID=A0A8D8FNN0_CULPI